MQTWETAAGRVSDKPGKDLVELVENRVQPAVELVQHLHVANNQGFRVNSALQHKQNVHEIHNTAMQFDVN